MKNKKTSVALMILSPLMLIACGGGSSDQSDSPTPIYSTAEKVKNRPTVPVFSPWGVNKTAGSTCGNGVLWVDCDTKETPYAMTWVNRENYGVQGDKTDVANPASGIHPEQTERYTHDQDTLFLVSPSWNYWFPKWQTLDSNTSYYMDELFIPHEGDSIWERAYNLNIKDINLHDSLVKKAINIKNDGADGILFDWWHNYADGRSATDGTKDLFTELEIQQARIDIARKIRVAVGDEFIIMGNTNWEINDPSSAYLSGVFLELLKGSNTHYPTYKTDGVNSIEFMEEVLEYWNKNLIGLRVIALEAWNIGDEDDRQSIENIRLAGLFTMMALVIPDNGYILYPDTSVHTHDYYEVFKTDLGKAIHAREIISEGVGYKEFEQGFAIYNRTDQVSSFIIGDKNITIEALSGIVIGK